MKKSFVVVTSTFLFVSQLCFSNAVDERQQNQRDRIRQGVNSGELTAVETVRLASQQARIGAKEARYKADGEFTARERASIHRTQTRASARIYTQKHDAQDRN